MNAEAPHKQKRGAPVYADMEFAAHLAEAVANHKPSSTNLPWTPSCAMATIAFAAGMVLGHVGYDGEIKAQTDEMTGFMEMGRIKVGGGVWGRA